jgi:hypothetical protein
LTKADDIHDELEWIKEQNDPQKILDVASLFFKRVDLGRWRPVKIISLTGCGWTCELESYTDSGIVSCVLRHDIDRNRWEYNGHCQVRADAHVAEAMGVPISYLQGMSDALDFSSKTLKSLPGQFQRLTDIHNELRERSAKLKKREEKLTVEVVAKKVVRKVRRDCGRKTAKKIAQLQQLLQSFKWREWMSKTHDGPYQNVPPPMCSAPSDSKETDVPAKSGVYFVWCGSLVEYVGQSVCLSNRANIANHQNIHDGDELSWLEYPRGQLDFAESYYIGVCCPRRNFGKNAAWRKTEETCDV